MRLRHNPAAAPYVAAHESVLGEKEALPLRGRWRRELGWPKNAPLRLEIGCGRGRFIMEMAESDPESLFLGLELRPEMIMEALARRENVPANLRFLQLNAQLLPELFALGEVDTIYINFPDPWPKSRHAKRRLTGPDFLARYHYVLKPGGELRLKTDNQELYLWSRFQMQACPLLLVEDSQDLSLDASGVITEYESRFRRLGQPIFFLRLRKPAAE